ncbi:MAG: MMPL family transporter [Clostridia bacterium]|nr:MMPL family transporter [Clostridia bacterium]
MLKFGEFITKHKKIIVILAFLLLIPAIMGFLATRVNYDILVYLPSDIETIQGENILSEDFNMGGFSVVLVDGMKPKQLAKLEKDIEGVGNVEKVLGISDVFGESYPTEMIPDDIKEAVYKGDTTAILVTYKDKISDDETTKTVRELRKIVGKDCKISGMTATMIDTEDLSKSEVAIYVIIAVVLVTIVLQLSLDSFAAPIFMLLNIGMCVVYNMGTNVLQGQISYITQSISAVLQLGVTMDFSIFLYHSFLHQKETGKSSDEAMTHAIAETFTSVAGSSLTTIAGFLALCSMNLTLGRDIGIVMAKGVLLGVIGVVTILPAFILCFEKIIEKTKHKNVFPKFEKLKNFSIKNYKLTLMAFILILPIAYYGYKNTGIYYNLDKSLPETLESVQANNELAEKFNMTSMEMLLIDKDISDAKLNDMLEKIDEIDGIAWTLSYSKITKGTIPLEMMPDKIKDMLVSDKYQLVLINSEYEMATDELNEQIEKVNEIVKATDKNAILAGEGPLMKDLVEVADHDFKSVNIVSIVIILILMIFVLKSGSLPIILTIVIEFAIFINMGIPYYTHTTLPFVASIVIGTIQLGATIDYAILITTKYKENRLNGMNKKDSIDKALSSSIQSIIVSGLSFFAATIGVAIYSKIELIGSLCTLMARGAIISMIVVITVLPAFLMVLDKLVLKTTMKMKDIKN